MNVEDFVERFFRFWFVVLCRLFSFFRRRGIGFDVYKEYKDCPIFRHQLAEHGWLPCEECTHQFLRSIKARDATIEALIRERDDALYEARKRK